jgi:hypothetical protein
LFTDDNRIGIPTVRRGEKADETLYNPSERVGVVPVLLLGDVFSHII